MDNNLAQQAIECALNGDWKGAEKYNLQILKESPDDTEALNRLAKSYAEQGLFEKASKTTSKTLLIDPFNSIALKCQRRWKLSKTKNQPSKLSSADVFLEEPGKTKVVALVHPGSITQITKLNCGDQVNLNPHGHRVTITSTEGKYLGKLPDDLGSRIKKLISLGNCYSVCIKCVNSKNVSIFIKETHSSKKGSSFVSFPATDKANYISYVPPGLIHDNNSYDRDSSEDDAKND